MPAATASGLVAAVYRQVAQEMRLVVPPAMLHSPVPDLLAAYWMLLRESLLPTGEVGRATKEAVAAAVSVAAICPYCTEMHTVGLYDLSGEHDAEAIAGDRAWEVRDPRLREVALWARHAHEADRAVQLPAGLSMAARAELVGVVVSMHYLTRMVNIFLSNFLLPPGLGPRGRRRFKRGASVVMRPTLRAPHEPGRSLSLLPEAPVAGGSEWAAASPAVARALARAGAVFEAAGARVLSPAVRALVLQRLSRWRGEETGLGTAWCDELVAGLPPADRAAGRLALLASIASHQVSDDDVAEFRRYHPGDAAVIGATGWASFAAARLIGERQGQAGGLPPTTHDRGGAARPKSSR
ncbi:carboxymuconolactone decarboxylase family protein [Rhizomonospora bruguierae]|uniref:carboxymuconolactone decarboxylase family protein n=1 Tax=Rhizomonospora bruguierae TaxID=1581705 RepID=UPI0020BE518C|nr:carboxymuconolactone decarboxylase family protein [Micromonospora sp. NBRC 107566]